MYKQSKEHKQSYVYKQSKENKQSYVYKQSKEKKKSKERNFSLTWSNDDFFFFLDRRKTV